jgi:hypothetical protein
MGPGFNIPAPFQFNPLKHHLGYIREFISEKITDEKNQDTTMLVKELRRIGTSVMDIYDGVLSISEITAEVETYLESNSIENENAFAELTGKNFDEFRIITLKDSSRWTLKYHDDRQKYVHLFPARLSPYTFRVKANTLKSAILFYILVGKDFIAERDLNSARKLLGLSPVRSTSDTEAINEMIEILRDKF